MDLGIKGRKGIVGGASTGLGRACALALAREGVGLTIAARTAANIESAAEEISSETGVRIRHQSNTRDMAKYLLKTKTG